ncbi:MAG: hypothetical protein WBP87_05680 [Candidatus Sulfotelmatobacter sp.]
MTVVTFAAQRALVSWQVEGVTMAEVSKEAVQRIAVEWTIEGILREVFPVQLSFTQPTNDDVQQAVDHAVHELLGGLYKQGLISDGANLYPSIPLVFPKAKAKSAAATIMDTETGKTRTVKPDDFI